MCGIAVTTGNVLPPPSRRRALERLRHRGPDACGDWQDGAAPVWLGHRRLAIVDLSANGNQPLANEDGRIQVVCNGEIYNYANLRSRLEGLGHTFASDSDSEILVHAYEEWGEDCVDQLEGMFAFALWDTRKQRLLAARDRVGMKPLYYHVSPQGQLALASEAGSLAALLPAWPAPDPEAIAYVMTLGYVPSPWSIWQGCRKLEPGHLLTWQSGDTVRLRRYWAPPTEVVPETNAAYDEQQEWEQLLSQVMREHLLGDVPIGLFLSGGIDSTTVAVTMRELGYPATALTVTFPSQPDRCEGDVARQVAGHLGLEHICIPLEITDVRSLLDSSMHQCDEPAGYSAWLSMHLLCQVASRHFKVIMAGDGGDEVFAGYRWYHDLSPEQAGFHRWARRAIRSAGGAATSISAGRIASSLFRRSGLLHGHAWRVYPRFLPEEAEAILRPMGVSFGDEQMLLPLQRHLVPSLPTRRALQRIDLMTFCSDAVLPKVDRLSMAFSMEVRTPLLDRRIVEWGLTRPMPREGAFQGKDLLRRYLRSRVPRAVLEHRKQGFSLPILNQLDWSEALEEIEASPWVQEGYWSPRWRRCVRPGVRYREARIWNLLSLAKWGEHWLRGKASVNHRTMP